MQLGILVGFLLLLSSCSSKKYLAENEYILDRVYITSDSSNLAPTQFSGYLRQQPNVRWLSLIKVPLGIYLMSNPNSNNGFNRFLRRMGEAPVVYDTLLSERSRIRIKDAVFNMGYLHANVSCEKKITGHKTSLTYHIQPGNRYYINDIDVLVQDTLLIPILDSISSNTLIHKGMPFDANILNQERSRITRFLTENGYYYFNRDYIRYEIDTLANSNAAALTMIIGAEQSSDNSVIRPHQQYRVGKIAYNYDTYTQSPIRIKESTLKRHTSLKSGDIFKESNLSDTYSRINQLGAVAGTNIQIEKDPYDSSLVNANVIITPARLNSIQLSLEGTNTSGDLGVAASLTYQNRNLFHGSEVLSIKARTAFEDIKGLDGYADHNYFEYGIEAGLEFPDFIFPFLSKKIRNKTQAKTEFALMFASQNRPEFHRRVLTSTWRYKWNSKNPRQSHKFDLLDINYVFMPWISETFYDTYIKDPESRNAIIAYNYKNLFIVKMGYEYQYSSIGLGAPMGIYGEDAYRLRFAVETAGNFINGICSAFDTKINEDGQRTLFNIAYAQYAKLDFDISKSFRFSKRTSLAMHFALGIAYPYGNSNILPYEKRYFSGGANSVRGWSVRSLGPGSFLGNDGRIDFINQTGDVKLDMNVEFRAHLFWKFDGAVFIDAGNIWTLRDYKEQPGGQFKWNTCWEQIAVSYGMGIRLNLNYFLLRFDAGMKAINPAYQDRERHYPLFNPNFKRDFAFHFAVGLPF